MKNKNYIQGSVRMSEEEQKTCFKKGINYLDQGKYEEALKIFGMLLMGEPRNASLHYYKGNTLHKLGRYEEALESFKVAIGFKPWEGAYYYGLASSYYALGKMVLKDLRLYRKRYLLMGIQKEYTTNIICLRALRGWKAGIK